VSIVIVAYQVLLVLAAVGVTGFALVFGLTVGWRRDPIMVTTLVFSGCEAAVLDVSVAAMVAGRSAVSMVLAFVALAAFTAGAWWRLVVIMRIQFGRGEPTAGTPPHDLGT
jgi:hypothetical protein